MNKNSINHDSIKLLVDTFYTKVREVPELQSIFEKQIGTSQEEWRPHLEKMYSFWNSILLREGSYHGRPMDVHRDLPPFPPELFDVWLNAFTQTAKQIFNNDDAMTINKRAQTIAQSLKAGIY